MNTKGTVFRSANPGSVTLLTAWFQRDSGPRGLPGRSREVWQAEIVSHEHHQEPDRTREPRPVRMSQQEFEDVVGDALDRIPADLAEVMDNVVVLVQDEPDPEMLTEEDYDDSGLPTLLGLYDGVPLTERDEGWSMVLPDRILIFRGPLERWCSSREELEEEITVTVIHEVAHHFGIPDERLHELGWE